MPPPFPIPYPLLNGNRYSFSSIGFLASGQEIVGVTSIDYDQELKPGDVYGTSPQLIGATKGQLKVTASLMMLQWEYENFITALCALNGTPGSGYMEARFDYVVQFQDGVGANQGPLFTHILRGCKIAKETDGYKVGPEANATKIELHHFYTIKSGNLPMVVTGTSAGFIPG
jgi:hypothetical protein